MNNLLSFSSMQVKQHHQSEQHYESNITQINHQQNSTTTVNGQYQVGPNDEAIVFRRFSKTLQKSYLILQTFLVVYSTFDNKMKIIFINNPIQIT